MSWLYCKVLYVRKSDADVEQSRCWSASKHIEWWRLLFLPPWNLLDVPSGLSIFFMHQFISLKMRVIYRKYTTPIDKDWHFSNPVLAKAHKSSSIFECIPGKWQFSDRLFCVHTSPLVISSIFKTIKQWREDRWLGNPWILIYQHNEIEGWGGLCRTGSGCRNTLRTVFFFTCLFSFTALPCGHDENKSLQEVCNCSKPGCVTQWDAICGRLISGKPATRENTASDRVGMATPDEHRFTVKVDQIRPRQ